MFTASLHRHFPSQSISMAVSTWKISFNEKASPKQVFFLCVARCEGGGRPQIHVPNFSKPSTCHKGSSCYILSNCLIVFTFIWMFCNKALIFCFGHQSNSEKILDFLACRQLKDLSGILLKIFLLPFWLASIQFGGCVLDFFFQIQFYFLKKFVLTGRLNWKLSFKCGANNWWHTARKHGGKLIGKTSWKIMAKDVVGKSKYVKRSVRLYAEQNRKYCTRMPAPMPKDVRPKCQKRC